MKGCVPPDPETNVSTLRYASVRVARRGRNRLPASCVTVCESASDAISNAAQDAALRPAEVLGPSKSSEGQYLYYLVRWLDE